MNAIWNARDISICRAPEWRLSLLGTWRLSCVGHPCESGANGRRLVALLALRGTLDRAYVSGTLWPNCSESHARGNLRATLSRLHQRTFACPVDSSDGALSLTARVTVDVGELVNTAWSVLDGEADLTGHRMLEILDNEDLLPGWYEDWVLVDRDRIRNLKLHALEALSAQFARVGNGPAALDAALAALAIDPLRESAHRAVISLHVTEGNLVEARRQLTRLRGILHTELGVEPSRLTTDLVEGRGASIHPPGARVGRESREG